MKLERFEEIVRKLEKEAAHNPGGYRTRVGLLAALGFGFVLLLLAATLALLAGLIWLMVSARFNAGAIKLVIVLGMVAFAILRSLYVHFEAADGIPLTRADALPLFQTVDRMTAKLGAPRFHHIHLTDDFNAAVYQRPRLGIFGWQTNYLLVGLPLMRALSPEQFESVLAHELGHLRGGHGRFGAWVYRVNATWHRLMAQLGDEGAAGAILRGFFKWYAPFFAAYSFALRRQDEYEADRCAANLTSPRAAADALCALPALAKHQNEHYWKDVYDGVKLSPTPPAAPFTGFVQEFRAADALSSMEAEASLREAMAEDTGFADSHPALKDRLRSLGEEPRLPAAPETTAADTFFGPNVARLAGRLDADWREKIAPAWAQRHAMTQMERQELAKLDAKAQNGAALTPEEAMQRASWAEDYRSPEEGAHLYYEVAQRPDAQAVGAGSLVAAAYYNAGRILLSKNNELGVAYMDEAMRRSPDAITHCLGQLHEFHKRRGDEDAARDCYRRHIRHLDRMGDAEEEREKITGKGVRYLPHGLPDAQIEALRAELALHPDIAEAYLVRKEVELFPEKPMYVLGFTLTGEWKRLQRDEDVARVTATLYAGITTLRGLEFTPVALAGGQKQFAKTMAAVPGSLVYSVGKSAPAATAAG